MGLQNKKTFINWPIWMKFETKFSPMNSKCIPKEKFEYSKKWLHGKNGRGFQIGAPKINLLNGYLILKKFEKNIAPIR